MLPAKRSGKALATACAPTRVEAVSRDCLYGFKPDEMCPSVRTTPGTGETSKGLTPTPSPATMLTTGMMQTLHERYRDVRRRTRQIFELVAPEAFDMRPIPLRHPIRFYEGHLASFNFGMLLQSGFAKNDPQPELTTFFARGIDPLDTSAADKLTIEQWPNRAAVADYMARVEDEMTRAFAADIDPIYLHTAVEHEEMHQETLMYLIHQLPDNFKRKPADARSDGAGALAPASWIRIEAGVVQLGADPQAVPFGWDNEFPPTPTEVAAAEIASRKVSNGDFLEFVNSGGYTNQKLWSDSGWRFIQDSNINEPPFWSRENGEWQHKGLFESIPLPLDWPVYVSHIEARAFTRWRGCRLPTEAEWHRALKALPRHKPSATTLTLSHGIRRRFPSATAGSFSSPAMVGNGQACRSEGFPVSSLFRTTPATPPISSTDFISS